MKTNAFDLLALKKLSPARPWQWSCLNTRTTMRADQTRLGQDRFLKVDKVIHQKVTFIMWAIQLVATFISKNIDVRNKNLRLSSAAMRGWCKSQSASDMPDEWRARTL